MKTGKYLTALVAVVLLASCAGVPPTAKPEGCCATKSPSSAAAKVAPAPKSVAVAPTSRCGPSCGDDCEPGACRCCAGGPCQRKKVVATKKPKAPTVTYRPAPPGPEVRVAMPVSEPAPKTTCVVVPPKERPVDLGAIIVQ